MSRVIDALIPVESTGENPFSVYISDIETSYTPPIPDIGLLADQANYDRTISTDLKDAELEFYNFVIDGEAPSDAVKQLLVKFARDRKFNAKPETTTARKMTNLSKIIKLASSRPKDSKLFDDESNFRETMLKLFAEGSITYQELFLELENYEGQQGGVALREDQSSVSTKGACLGLHNLMFGVRGENTIKQRELCLGCAVFAQCAVVTFASCNEVGVRVAMSDRERVEIRSEIGTKALRNMLNDPRTDLFRSAAREIFMEYQELVQDVGLGATGKERDQIRRGNKATFGHLKVALGRLTALHSGEN